jgi:hypothetical protein
MSQSLYLVIVGIPNLPLLKLMFNNETRAREVYRALRGSDRGENDFEIEVCDDYGQEVTVNRDETPLIHFQDLARVLEGRIAITVAGF